MVAVGRGGTSDQKSGGERKNRRGKGGREREGKS